MLLPRRGFSGRAAAEATACGVPALGFAEAGPLSPYGAVVRGGPGARLVRDGTEYVQQARAAKSRTAPAVEAGSGNAAAFARALEDQAQHALAVGAAA
jgi:hypothetical protein